MSKPRNLNDIKKSNKRIIVLHGLIIVFLVAAFSIAPVLLLNWSDDHSKNYPDGFILASIEDWQTWFVSAVIWMLINYLYQFLSKPLKSYHKTSKNNVDESNKNGYSDRSTFSNSEASEKEAEEPESAADNDKIDGQDKPSDNRSAKILGLSGKASMREIRSAYRKKIAEYHPHKVAHLGPKLQKLAEKESKQINEAYNYFEEKYGDR